MTNEKPPNPGSPAAVAAGCTCAVLDNNHGEGFPYTGGNEMCFWISDNCPLHGGKP